MGTGDHDPTTEVQDDARGPVRGYFVPVSNPGPGPENGFVEIWALVRRYRYLLIAGPLVGGIAMLLLSFVATPKYRVEVLLAPVDHSAGSGALSQLGGTLGGLGALAGLNLGDSGDASESIAVLGSRALTTEFITQNGLLPVLFAADWDADKQAWQNPKPDHRPSLEEAYYLFDRQIRTISQERDTGLVRLSITWRDREQAADWANHLVERANALLRQRAISEYERSIEYLNAELEKTNVVGLRQAIYSVIESQIEKVMLANVREDYAFKVLDPAVAPDADDTAYPSRPLFVFVGLVLGFVLSAAASAVLSRRSA